MDIEDLLALGGRRRRLLVAVVVTALVGVFMLVTGADGAQLGLIPTLIASSCRSLW